jgi:hypothetical protein
MERREFWIAVGWSTAAYFVAVQLALTLSLSVEFGRLAIPALHWPAHTIAFRVVEVVAICLLMAQLYSFVTPAEAWLRQGFRFGVYCGLLVYAVGGINSLAHGGKVGNVLYYAITTGFAGGLAGTLIARAFHVPARNDEASASPDNGDADDGTSVD